MEDVADLLVVHVGRHDGDAKLGLAIRDRAPERLGNGHCHRLRGEVVDAAVVEGVNWPGGDLAVTLVAETWAVPEDVEGAGIAGIELQRRGRCRIGHVEEDPALIGIAAMTDAVKLQVRTLKVGLALPDRNRECLIGRSRVALHQGSTSRFAVLAA